MPCGLDLLLDEDESLYTTWGECDAETKYLLLCGARWANHRDRSAAAELIAALESGSAALASIAGTLLTEGCERA